MKNGNFRLTRGDTSRWLEVRIQFQCAELWSLSCEWCFIIYAVRYACRSWFMAVTRHLNFLTELLDTVWKRVVRYLSNDWGNRSHYTRIFNEIHYKRIALWMNYSRWRGCENSENSTWNNLSTEILFFRYLKSIVELSKFLFHFPILLLLVRKNSTERKDFKIEQFDCKLEVTFFVTFSNLLVTIRCTIHSLY